MGKACILYLPLNRIFDVRVDQQAVHFRMNVLDGDLEAVEEASFGDLHFLAETFHLRKKMFETGSAKKPTISKRNQVVKIGRLNTANQNADRCSSDRPFVTKRLTRFSLTMPSLAAKKAKTWEMKCFSLAVSASHCCTSFDRSTSSVVQNEATAFLYICQDEHSFPRDEKN